MTAEDIPFAVDITRKENWDYTREDFQRLIDFEPGGCFVAFDEEERVAMLTTTSYGSLGWIGNVVVKSDRRGEGIGSKIVRHGVSYLTTKAVDAIGLYSYSDSVDFYERIGFRQSYRVTQFSGPAKVSENRGTRNATDDILPRIERMDKDYFGADRGRILRRMIIDFPDLFFYAEEGVLLGYIVGFCSPKACEIGPWVCNPDRADLAENLLVDCLSVLENPDSRVAVPNENKRAFEIVRGQGFYQDFEVVAMFYGSSRHRMKQDAIFGVGALEKG